MSQYYLKCDMCYWLELYKSPSAAKRILTFLRPLDAAVTLRRGGIAHGACSFSASCFWLLSGNDCLLRWLSFSKLLLSKQTSNQSL